MRHEHDKERESRGRTRHGRHQEGLGRQQEGYVSKAKQRRRPLPCISWTQSKGRREGGSRKGVVIEEGCREEKGEGEKGEARQRSKEQRKDAHCTRRRGEEGKRGRRSESHSLKMAM